MTKIIPLLLCLSAACFAEPYDKRCDELDKAMDDLFKIYKEKNDEIYFTAIYYFFSKVPVKNCECTEKINCREVDFCVSYKCDNEEVSVFSDIHRFAAKIGGAGTNSGITGQPKDGK